MYDTLPKNAMHSIPDDPETSTYRFIIVAAKRARQLQNGSRSFLPTTSRKPTVCSMACTASMFGPHQFVGSLFSSLPG